MKKRTKILATIGPASESLEMIEKLMRAGVNVFRLNFSHGTHEYHYEVLQRIRQAEKNTGLFVGVLQDISGPKIRVGKLKEPFKLESDDMIEFVKDEIVGFKKGEKTYTTSINQPTILDQLKVGENIYLCDGTIRTEVIEHLDDVVKVKVKNPGILSSKKGVNFPNTCLGIDVLTKKDRDDMLWGIKNGVDFMAISFVQDANDMIDARKIITEHGARIQLFAKIEKFDAIQNIDSIIEASDGIMVARGDLGIEVPFYEVPSLQKMLIKKTNEASKPVITATQMLTSMIKHFKPTRAEVSDIANAVLDGTDAVMLSDETTIGEYPVEAVRVMINTIIETEKIYPFFRFYGISKEVDLCDAIAETAVRLAKEVKADGLIVFTKSGLTAKRVSRLKPAPPIYAISPDKSILNRLAISWGVIPYYQSLNTTNADELLIEFLKKSEKDFGRDNIFIATIGYPSGVPNSTNIVRTIRKQDYDYFLACNS